MKDTNFGIRYKKLLINLLTVFVFTATSPAFATEVCYDYSDLPLNSELWPGDSLNLGPVTIYVNALQTLAGTFIDHGEEVLNVNNSNIVGTSPELHQYFSTLRIEPVQPLTKVTMRFAQNGGINDNYLYSNLGINYERLQLKHGIASADGLVFGDNQIGQIQFSTSLANISDPADGYWMGGDLTLTALNGGIATLTIGSVQTKIDDICLTY